ncbi:alpha/beta fold hydrolase [Massilia putida]|uniref:alpha/beta fold hydrolase n=1 Tax=Massilia putida TaxID=1141883 RepID=UPI000951F005|nr:alpha/beta hydrolase [Massilia putida]
MEQTITVENTRMSWVESGSGFPVVLVHGIPTSPALWRHVTPRLPGARCIAWEMVGYGSSRVQGRGRDISVARQADYLAAFVDALGISRAVFAGHDLGGGVVQILAVRRPDLCAGLMLTNAIAYDSWPIPSVKALATSGGLVRHLPPAALKMILRMMFLRGHVSKEKALEALRVHWAMYSSRFGPDAFVRQVQSLDTHDTLAVAGQLSGLTVPVRVVWGEADQLQKIEYGERLSRDLKAPLYRIPGGKHFTPEDYPDIVAAAIDELLAQASNHALQENVQ